jgi:hypothetical protein
VLIPREHGAYGQLLFPLFSALLIGHPAAGAYLLAAAAVAAFLGHESLMIVLGQRGARHAREHGPEARRTLAMFGGFCLVTGAVAVAVLPRGALLYLSVPVALVACAGLAVAARAERTTGGEVLVAFALSSVALPVALAGATSTVAAFTVFAVFASASAAATVAVRSMIGRVTRAGGPPPMLAGVLALGIVAALEGLGVAGRLSPVAPYAASPVCAVAIALAVKPPAPRRLRAVGWALVAATSLSAAILVAALA